MEEYKQCVVVRSDLGLSKGKIAVQAAHASILSYESAPAKDRIAWMKSGQKKIVLRAKSITELYILKERARLAKIPSEIVVDAGLTQVPPETVTAIGIGPARAKEIDRITGHLKLL
jgi:PTH2 family peptidyl-tRNA hydrolase